MLVRRLRQADLEFKVRLHYIARPCLGKKREGGREGGKAKGKETANQAW
jgi:hypothetical protein